MMVLVRERGRAGRRGQREEELTWSSLRLKIAPPVSVAAENCRVPVSSLAIASDRV